MSYNTKNGMDILGGFKPRSAQPIDVRTKVATIAERDELVTNNVVYTGLSVWVDEDNKSYEWNGTEWKAAVTGVAYTHPDTHPATMIEEDETHRFVTDEEKTAWAAKASSDVATTEKDGLMSAADKTKFDEMSTGFADKVDKTREINGHALSENITLTAGDVGAIPATQKGAANGVAELDANGTVNQDQLPAYVNDVIDVFIVDDKFYLAVDGAVVDVTETTEVGPELGKIYADIENNKGYRWTGTTYTKLSDSIALGEVEGSAYRGDRGKIAYDHSQEAHAPFDAQKNVQSDWNQTDEAADDFIKNKPEAIEVKGGNVETVGGHTVKTDVPENAVFTDTTYEVYTDTTDGLVPKTGALTEAQLRFLEDNKTWQKLNLKVELVEIVTGENESSIEVYVKLVDGAGYNLTKTIFPTVSSTGYGLMTPELLEKLEGIEENATAYEHPETHPATMITEDEDHKFVTDVKANEWNAKASKDTATSDKSGLMSATDKEKLDGLGEGAGEYTHPDTHPATMITEDEDHKFASNTDIATWAGSADIFSGISEKDKPKEAPSNSLFLKVVAGKSIEEEYPLYYDSEAGIGLKEDEDGNLSYWHIDSEEKVEIFDSDKVSPDVETNDDAVIIVNGKPLWAYPNKHPGEAVPEQIDETELVVPEQHPGFYAHIDNTDIAIYKGDQQFNYRMYDRENQTYSEPYAFTKILEFNYNDNTAGTIKKLIHLKPQHENLNYDIMYNDDLDKEYAINKFYKHANQSECLYTINEIKNDKIVLLYHHGTSIEPDSFSQKYYIDNGVFNITPGYENYIKNYDKAMENKEYYYNYTHDVAVFYHYSAKKLRWKWAQSGMTLPDVPDWYAVYYDDKNGTVNFDENREDLVVWPDDDTSFAVYLNPEYNNRSYIAPGPFTSYNITKPKQIIDYYDTMCYDPLAEYTVAVGYNSNTIQTELFEYYTVRRATTVSGNNKYKLRDVNTTPFIAEPYAKYININETAECLSLYKCLNYSVSPNYPTTFWLCVITNEMDSLNIPIEKFIIQGFDSPVEYEGKVFLGYIYDRDENKTRGEWTYSRKENIS